MPISTHVFRVDGMHCASCSLLIDDTLEDLPGVSQSQTALKAGLSTVQLDVTRTDPQQVIDAITGLGYTAVALQR
jgi:copper chaperone